LQRRELLLKAMKIFPRISAVIVAFQIIEHDVSSIQ
jgi:hypothetical protein